MCNVIFLFGPSCAGKSTLGIALQNDLGNDWTYIDRDDLPESEADETLEKRIESVKNLIIDAQIPWREKKMGEFYFVVLPPLDILLQRDAERSEELHRSAKRAHYAREYVLETYNTLSAMKQETFDHCFDSSKESVTDEINRIKSVIKMTNQT